MKKIIALILALVIFASGGFCSSVYAEDISVHDSLAMGENAYNFLRALGIIEADKVEYSAEMTVSRGMFCQLAICIGNYDDVLPKATGEVFSDVAVSNPYAPYVEMAYSLGMVSGYDNGEFGVNDAITLSQAEKILICVLGYERLAKYNGGYPVGYTVISNTLKLTDSLNIQKEENLNMSNAMLLLRNAVNCSILVPTGIVNNEAEFVIDKNKTVLSERFKIYSVTGILCANGYTDLLTDETIVDYDSICVGNTALKYDGDSGFALGCDVEVWYDYSTLSARALYIEKTENNKIWKVEAGDVSFSDGYADCQLEDDDVKKLRLSEYASYILNGKAIRVDFDKFENINKGTFEFVSNDGDSVIDVVLITGYDTYRVQGVGTDAMTLLTDTGEIFTFDPENDNLTVSIHKDGLPVELNSVVVGDIILVAASSGTGKNFLRILTESSKVTDVITEIGDETITIGNKAYPVDESLKESLTLGLTYEASFDALGNIAYTRVVNNSYVYGFLYAVASQTFKTSCQIFSEYNNWVELEFASKVKIDDKVYKNDEIADYFDALTEKDIRQLIRYNVNESNQVVMIDFAKEVLLGSDNEKEAVKSDEFRLSFDGSARYLRTPQSFDGRFYVDATLKTFEIPADYNKDDFIVTEGNSYSNDSTYTLKAYDVDEKLNATVIVKTAPADKYTSFDYPSGYPFMVVTSKGQCLDYEGDAKPSVSGYYNGQKITFPVSIDNETLTQADYDNLKKGDVIQVNYDDHGVIRYFKKYNTANNEFESYTGKSAIFNSAVMKSEVVDVIDGTVNFAIDYNGRPLYILGYYTSPVYLYDKKTDTLKTISTLGIMTGDTIVLRCYNYALTEAIVIR